MKERYFLQTNFLTPLAHVKGGGGKSPHTFNFRKFEKNEEMVFFLYFTIIGESGLKQLIRNNQSRCIYKTLLKL